VQYVLAEFRMLLLAEHAVTVFCAPLEVVYVVAQAVTSSNEFFHKENLLFLYAEENNL